MKRSEKLSFWGGADTVATQPVYDAVTEHLPCRIEVQLDEITGPQVHRARSGVQIHTGPGGRGVRARELTDLLQHKGVVPTGVSQIFVARYPDGVKASYFSVPEEVLTILTELRDRPPR